MSRDTIMLWLPFATVHIRWSPGVMPNALHSSDGTVVTSVEYFALPMPFLTLVILVISASARTVDPRSKCISTFFAFPSSEPSKQAPAIYGREGLYVFLILFAI